MYSIDSLTNKINQALKELPYSHNPPELYEPIIYTLLMGGKRMRPLLCLLACDLFGENVDASLQAAIGLEIFHNFTLVHDDIMDKAPLRRGKDTVYQKWDTNIAILSGDTMFALAYECLLKTKIRFLPDVLAVFNKTAIQVCEGQQIDMNFETSEHVNIDDYIKMIRLKTAVLLGASLQIGGIIGGAKKQDLNHLYHFGEQLGISFQLMDDMLDVYGDQEKFGKISGGDIVTNKKTYLFLKALEEAKGDIYKKLTYYFSEPEIQDDIKVKEVKAIYEQLQIKTYTEKEIEKYYYSAINHLNSISLTEKEERILKSIGFELVQEGEIIILTRLSL